MNKKQKDKDIHTKGKNNKKKKYQFIRKGHGNEPTVIEFNLSKAVILLIAIGVIIVTITTVKVITTIMRAQENKALAGEESNEHVVWVESTDVDEEGNPIKVPVPKGYSASKIPGETSANNGFVIYEGEVDWDSILVDTASQNTISTQSVENEEPSANDTAIQGEENTTNTINQNENTIDANTTNANNANNTDKTEKNTTTDNKNSQTDQANTVEQENMSNEQNIIEENKQETSNNGTTGNENQLQEETIKTETSSETEKTPSTENNKQVTNQTEAENLIQEETNTAQNANNEQNTIVQEQENNQETTNASQQIEINAQILETEATTTETTNTSNAETVEPRAVNQQDINIFNLQKERNQYVWVPVKDPSRIYGVDSNGKLWGKLYDYSSIGRSAINWRETSGIMSINNKTDNREPDITHYNTDFDIDSRLQSFLDGKTQYELLLKELEENFYLTIKSIKEYGGFYIGRYETGNLSGTAVVRKMNEDIGGQTWYTMYEKIKELKGENDNVMTSMIWGSLWDETLQWLIDSGATTSDGTKLTYELIGYDSTTWGNCANSTFKYIPSGSTTPEATTEKEENRETRIPTGSSEYTKVNNIYNLAGNVFEWTLETASTYYTIIRGGNNSADGSYRPADFRIYRFSTDSSDSYGFRTSLFIR